jgi:hypothetical protein
MSRRRRRHWTESGEKTRRSHLIRIRSRRGSRLQVIMSANSEKDPTADRLTVHLYGSTDRVSRSMREVPRRASLIVLYLSIFPLCKKSCRPFRTRTKYFSNYLHGKQVPPPPLSSTDSIHWDTSSFFMIDRSCFRFPSRTYFVLTESNPLRHFRAYHWKCFIAFSKVFMRQQYSCRCETFVNNWWQLSTLLRSIRARLHFPD